MDMRIANAYNAFSVYDVKNSPAAKKANRAEKTNPSQDTFTVSEKASDYQLAKKAVNAASDIREDKVAAVKQRLASGSYKVSGYDIAAKLFQGRNE